MFNQVGKHSILYVPLQIPDTPVDESAIAAAAEPGDESAITAAAETLADQPASNYICYWNNCCMDCYSFRNLVLHVNDHISSLNWSSTHSCQWAHCWNKHCFTLQDRLVEHVRVHTLEQPFVCPVKSCKMKFAIKSNCMAHGRTRHNRSFKPVIVDIARGEIEVEDEEEEENEEEFREEAPRKKKGERKARGTRNSNEKILAATKRQMIVRSLKYFQDHCKDEPKINQVLKDLEHDAKSTVQRAEYMAQYFEDTRLAQSKLKDMNDALLQFNAQIHYTKQCMAESVQYAENIAVPALKLKLVNH